MARRPAKPVRARTERREQQRGLRREVRERERMAHVAPGGAADRPILVTSAAVIEVRARSERCVHCAGELELRRHTAPVAGEGRLREVELVCRVCHAARRLWFQVQPVLPS